MMRNIISVVVGVVTAIGVFLIAERLVHLMYPIPQGFDMENPDALNAYLQAQPIFYWILILTGWVLGSFVAGYLIKRLSRSASWIQPAIAGLLLTLSGIANIFLFYHPVWFVALTFIVFFAGVFTGHRLGKI